MADLDIDFGVEVLTNDFNVSVYVVYSLLETEAGVFYSVRLYNPYKQDKEGKLDMIVSVLDETLSPLFAIVLPSQAFAVVNGWDLETGTVRVILHPVSLKVLYPTEIG